MIQLNKVRNNDGLNVKTILKQNIATVKSLSLSSQMCTSEYLELCDDAHRCLALYNSATTCLNSKQENCDTIKSGGAARDRDTDGDRAMDRDRDSDRNRNWERDGASRIIKGDAMSRCAMFLQGICTGHGTLLQKH